MPPESIEQSILERIFETSPTGIVVLTADGEITRTNQRAEQLLELTETDIEGRTYDDAAWTFVDADGEEVPEHDHPFVRVLTDGAIYDQRYSIELSHAGRLEVSISGAPIRGPAGDILRVVFSFQDVSERVERERRLERQANRLKAFSVAFPDLAFIVSREGRYLDYIAGERSEEYLYEDPETFLDRTAYDIFPEDTADEQVSIVRTAIETGETVTHEYALELSEGERWFEAQVEALPFEYDGEEVAIWVARDITDSRRRERELAQQNDRLESFASIVSHDLRSPLSVAQGWLEQLEEEVASDHIEPIATALDRMNRIIDDLLFLAREGQTIGATEPVDLMRAVEDAWDMVAGHSGAADLVTEGLDGPGSTDIIADGTRLRQALENLFRNAIEHGGDDLTVTVGTLDSGFFVEDDGPGIPVSKREEVFNPGYSTNPDGTGFGLNIVKQVAEGHGWTVTVDEGTDGGARFEFTDAKFAER